MRRTPREFRAESFELEGRLLQTVVPVLIRPSSPMLTPVLTRPLTPASTPAPPAMKFDGFSIQEGYLSYSARVVSQQAGEATVTLTRADTAGSLRVRVTTVPSSPFVGVNVGAVNQAVTFADGQAQAAVTVPILPGAPNPGVVDVYLDATPIDFQIPASGVVWTPLASLDLKVMASEPTLPPRVVSTVATSEGIVLAFNKPMNPVGASNVKNYAVRLVTTAPRSTGDPLSQIFGRNTGTKVSVRSAQLLSARYDPANRTVTLISKPRNPSVNSWAPFSLVHAANARFRPGHSLKAAQALTDLQGNPINARTTPGKVALVGQKHGYAAGW